MGSQVPPSALPPARTGALWAARWAAVAAAAAGAPGRLLLTPDPKGNSDSTSVNLYTALYSHQPMVADKGGPG